MAVGVYATFDVLVLGFLPALLFFLFSKFSCAASTSVLLGFVACFAGCVFKG